MTKEELEKEAEEKYSEVDREFIDCQDEGVGFGIYGLDDKNWHTYDTGFEVIAWKEIVLP